MHETTYAHGIPVMQMTETRLVKARINYGSRSLSLTVPAEVRQEFSIQPGDVFEVTVSKNDTLTITYRKVYPSDDRGVRTSGSRTS